MTLNSADSAFVARLADQLPEGVLRPADPRYLEEPRGRYQGQAGLLAVPHSTEEVATLVRAAHEARVPVVPYGGGTGLVGGQVMPEGPAPLLLSLEKMTAIRGVYPAENVLIAEAGAILADVQAAATEAGRLFPLSLAAEGSARIGGNLATNAGGVNVLRYGNARDLCLGLEAVLPNGDIWHGLSRLRKDNTGYDLRNLLVGSEGSLGVITAASLKLSPIPAAQGTAVFVVPSPQAAIALLSLARDQLGEGISAFELMHRQGLAFLAETMPQVRQPFAEAPEWCVLIELGLARGLDPEEALADLFEAALEADLAQDGVIAQSAAQREALWTVRETIPEANRLIGAISSHDISVPISEIPDFITRGGEAIARLGVGDMRINCFGHLGDGNLHYNVFPAAGKTRKEYEHLREDVKRTVHDLVADFDGSMSAEHGIGRMKTGDLERYGDPVKLAAMRAIKDALDPHGIMNPGAVLRQGT
ncbi:2-hydroxyacid dehydrogenase [Phaeobacter gallaeciensis]|uniref:2-hydroxyacid dehydrogenase n=1 Tax=Phaeobacter gallaeciensis TaxID=60890 RepID=A0A1B0ZUY4_9RHOB|nr:MULTISPECIES: FAD-binding oxidoreductase [Phaeobacter]ANP37976.1 2-hydroxyacid dehydrogenase [Phaeobacter gallaeciensis]MEE2633730.1 FAD-binding oxidoreductase [Pseudomonadota bacterium]PVZ50629.1 FAD-binding oxidoreductase [Phaeobacter sp. JL2872]